VEEVLKSAIAYLPALSNFLLSMIVCILPAVVLP